MQGSPGTRDGFARAVSAGPGPGISDIEVRDPDRATALRLAGLFAEEIIRSNKEDVAGLADAMSKSFDAKSDRIRLDIRELERRKTAASAALSLKAAIERKEAGLRQRRANDETVLKCMFEKTPFPTDGPEIVQD